MGIIAWLVFGLLVGAIAKFVMPGNDPGGIVVTSLIGIAGAFIGGYIGTFLGLGTATGFDVRSIFVAVLGAVLLLAAYRKLRKA